MRLFQVMEFVSFCVEYFFCAGTCKYCNTPKTRRQAFINNNLKKLMLLLHGLRREKCLAP